jgi:hypothetical protein
MIIIKQPNNIKSIDFRKPASEVFKLTAAKGILSQTTTV